MRNLHMWSNKLIETLFKKASKIRIAYLIISLLIVPIIFAYFTIVIYGAIHKSSPILLEHKFFAKQRLSLCYPNIPDIIILNPWRDRTPEELAQRLLDDMGEGRCKEVVSTISASRRFDKEEDISIEIMAESCGEIASNPPWAWSLVDYGVSANQVVLFYHPSLIRLPGCNSKTVRFEIQKENGQVVIKSFVFL